MLKLAEPKKRRFAPPKNTGAYVRFTTRMFYLNNDAMKLLGNAESVDISVDAQQRTMIVSPGGRWKLSTVNETRFARRIENGSSLTEIMAAGFPVGMLGHYLACEKDMAGSLVVSLIPGFKKAV